MGLLGGMYRGVNPHDIKQAWETLKDEIQNKFGHTQVSNLAEVSSVKEQLQEYKRRVQAYQQYDFIDGSSINQVIREIDNLYKQVGDVEQQLLIIRSWENLKEELQTKLGNVDIQNSIEIASRVKREIQEYILKVQAYSPYNFLRNSVTQVLQALEGAYKQSLEIEEEILDKLRYNSFIGEINRELEPGAATIRKLQEPNADPDLLLIHAQTAKPQIEAARRRLENFQTRCNKATSLETLLTAERQLEEIINNLIKNKLLAKYKLVIEGAGIRQIIKEKLNNTKELENKVYEVNLSPQEGLALLQLKEVFPDFNSELFILQKLLETILVKISFPSEQPAQASTEDDVDLLVTGLEHMQPKIISPKTLHEAASTGKLGLVQALITQGSDLNAKDKNNCTALHGVAYAIHPNVKLAIWLVKEGLAIDARDHTGKTALHIAIEQGHLELAHQLISLGAAALKTKLP